jgi:CBS domain-containing protein
MQTTTPPLQPVPYPASGTELRAYYDDVTAAIGALLDSGMRVSEIGRLVARAHDALVARLLVEAEAELGPPPCAYAWLALGSAARREQTLHTDQDNALVYADPLPGSAQTTRPEVARYFAALSERTVERLAASGFPRCPGDVMATNGQWRQPLRVWQGYFQRWIMMPDAEALLRVAIFFDYRRIHGLLDVEAALRPTVLRARDEHTFLAYLAHTAIRQPAPIGLFGRVLLERDRDRRPILDLKRNGSALIVDLARLFGLKAGSPAVGTLDRLRDAADGGSLSRAGADNLTAAFEQINLLRLRHQYDLIGRGEPPSNDVPVGQLSSQERRALRDALRVVARIQRSVVFSFQTAWFG